MTLIDSTNDQPTYDPPTEQVILLLTRDAVRAALEGRRLARPADCPTTLLEPRGCFVTLRRGGQLRGCIGTFEADAPLVDNLIAMAGAAVRDPRFLGDPVTIAELDDLTIEVSVLTPREPIGDPRQYLIGIDGQYVTGKQFGSSVAGCFLPEVAIDQGWDVETALSMLCVHKMGLDPDAWRPPTKLQFYRFQSIKVAEDD